MFSFFGSGKKEKKYSATEIIDMLEKDDSTLQKSVMTFNKDYNERHHNTILLLAIAWDDQKAAAKLIDHDRDKIAINVKDDWPTCRNTPIISAAKINAESLIEKLILAGADINAQDYRGYTALHYACLYRNEKAIQCLLAANANLQLRDAFGKRPYDYYQMEIAEKDLRYRYGSHCGVLKPVSDFNNHYFATEKKCLSAIRWYIQHLIVNNNLGKSETIQGVSLNVYAQSRLTIREPVYRADFYEAMLKCFLHNRPKINLALQAQLYQSQSVSYSDEYDQYRLDPIDLVPRESIHHQENKKWIELQEISTPNYRL